MRTPKANILLTAAFFLCFALPCGAQFYSDGTEPGNLKWMELSTEHYRVLFPDFADSLARQYALKLENSWNHVGKTAGFAPTSGMKKKLPVVLHTLSATSNGLVVWAPARVELYTTPDCFSPGSVQWSDHLIIHESRHVSQLQFAYDRKFLPGRILFGELFPAALSAIYPGSAFLEGDAVATETALTRSGRGRNAEFLEYYKASFAQGDTRNYWRWRYGSNKYYTPDYYRAGYLQIAGIRALYNVPDLTERYYRRILEKPLFPFDNFNKTVKEATGHTFKEAWTAVCDSLNSEWAADRKARAPFSTVRAITKNHRRFTSYGYMTELNGKLYCLRNGLDRSQELVRIDSNGNIKSLHSMGYGITGLKSDRKRERILWTEEIPDTRWEMKSYSVVRYFGKDDKIHSLTRGTRYWQLCCSPSTDRYAVIEYSTSGSISVVVLDPESGKETSRLTAPDGLELTDITWCGDTIYASAIDDSGCGIFNASDNFSKVLGGIQAAVTDLDSFSDDTIIFACDCTGVNELYTYDFNKSICSKITNLPFGATDFTIARDSLYLSTIESGGRNIYVTKVDNFVDNFNLQKLNTSFIANSISKQEEADTSTTITNLEPLNTTARKYSTLAHLMRFHSWAPLFINYDSIESLSLSSIGSDVDLGASLFFQNELGTSSGFVGYHAASAGGKWQHSGHIKYCYRGWYPVIEFKGSINERNVCQYNFVKEKTDNMYYYKIKTAYASSPLLYAGIKAYIPLTFNSSGLSRGIIPNAEYSITNDRFSTSSGGFIPMQRLTLSLRGYIMRNIPASCIYPRWGFGLEGGLNFRPGLTNLFAGNEYVFAYAYLPGILRTHGIKFTAISERHFGKGIFAEAYANTVPRGFVSSDILQTMIKYDTRSKFTIDYALPFGNVDWSFLCPVAYIRNFELFLHADYSIMSSGKEDTAAVASCGADFNVVLGNLLWIPYTTRVGVTYDYLLPDKTHYVGMTFSISL